MSRRRGSLCQGLTSRTLKVRGAKVRCAAREVRHRARASAIAFAGYLADIGLIHLVVDRPEHVDHQHLTSCLRRHPQRARPAFRNARYAVFWAWLAQYCDAGQAYPAPARRHQERG